MVKFFSVSNPCFSSSARPPAGRKVEKARLTFPQACPFCPLPQHKWPLSSNSFSPLSVFLRDTQVRDQGHQLIDPFCLILLLTAFFLCRPDKLCDQVSDAVLDACLREDPNSKVACGALAETIPPVANRVPTLARELLVLLGELFDV